MVLPYKRSPHLGTKIQTNLFCSHFGKSLCLECPMSLLFNFVYKGKKFSQRAVEPQRFETTLKSFAFIFDHDHRPSSRYDPLTRWLDDMVCHCWSSLHLVFQIWRGRTNYIFWGMISDWTWTLCYWVMPYTKHTDIVASLMFALLPNVN